MESIYDPKGFNSSEHFSSKSYFETYSEICKLNLLSGLPMKKKSREYFKCIQNEIGVVLTKRNLKNLEEKCSISKLTLIDEPTDMPINVPPMLLTRSKFTNIYPITDDAKKLNVIKCVERLDKQFNMVNEFPLGGKRFLKTRVTESTSTSNKSSISGMALGSNFIYSILIYRPHAINLEQRNSGESLRFSYELEALGTNSLADIADSIVCIADIGLFKEVENTKEDLKPFMNAKEHYPSQCFFIDDVFYNDNRCSYSIDYSDQIIKWATEKNIGKFRSSTMDMTLLNSLKPRLGYPYVYMHQGNCEHIITFSDARLLQPLDCLQGSKYPRISSLSREKNILCFICTAVNSQWIVMECSKLKQEKAFLCTECCESYLYVDGEKITDFKLYPYYDQDMLTKNMEDID